MKIRFISRSEIFIYEVNKGFAKQSNRNLGESKIRFVLTKLKPLLTKSIKVCEANKPQFLRSICEANKPQFLRSICEAKKPFFSLLCAGVLMMNSALAWDNATLTQIDKADDLKIAPERANGKTGTPTWIWEVVVDNRLFVRPYNGKNSSWYKSAMAYKKGIIVAAGKTYQVSYAQIDDPALIKKVSDAYRKKYASSPYMSHMVQERIAAQTVEVMDKQ